MNSSPGGLGEKRNSMIVSAEHMPEKPRMLASAQPHLPGVRPERIGTYSSHGLKPGANGRAINKINQDRGFVEYPLNNDQQAALFCVYDGHGANGETVSEYVMWKVQELLHADAKHLYDEPERLLIRAFEETDRQLRNSPVQAEVSGTAAVVIIALGNHLWVANTGDSRAVIAELPVGNGSAHGKGLTVTALSKDQKPDDPEEAARIRKCGGYVSEASLQLGPPRVWLRKGEGPGLAMSRSLGDHISSHVGVVATPVVTHFVMKEGCEYVLVVASDGVWEFIESEEACKLVASHGTAADSCAALIDESSRRWRVEEGNYRDDITAIVCRFPFFPKPGSSALPNNPVSFDVQASLSTSRSESPPPSHEAGAGGDGNNDNEPQATKNPLDDERRSDFETRRLTVQGEFKEGSDEAKRLEALRQQYS